MSFYVTLPSNSSSNLFDNTTSQFTTQLQIPIRLDRPYEVGLVEITYDHNWDVDMGQLLYFHSDRGVIFSSNIILHDGENFDNFLFRLNNDIGPKILKYEYEKLHNEMPNVNDNEIGQKLKSKLLEKNSKNTPFITVKNRVIIAQTLGLDHYFLLRGTLGELLGINNKLINNTTINYAIENFGDNFYFIRSLYVYTDIVKYQYVGDTLAPLLRNVVVPNQTLTTQNVIYDAPHYLPINKTIIDTINIRITDELGNNIRFRRGKTIVKLHFRPINNGF